MRFGKPIINKQTGFDTRKPVSISRATIRGSKLKTSTGRIFEDDTYERKRPSQRAPRNYTKT